MYNFETMRKNMEDAGVYSSKDIDSVISLEKQYIEECEEIALQCGWKAGLLMERIMICGAEKPENIMMSKLHLLMQNI